MSPLASELSLQTTSSSRATIRDRVLALLVWLTVLGLVGQFLLMVWGLITQGAGQLSWSFLSTDPQDVGRAGGIRSILAATALLLGVCLGTAIPLGVGTAILLSEFTRSDHWFGRVVRRSLDMLAGVPSIVFGLFGNAFFSITLGLKFSILAGGMTLSCMVLPILIRSVEEGLREVPDDFRLGAASLGLSQTSTLWHLILPAAVPSLVAGFVLGLGRAVAETAALIFTSGYVDRFPTSLLDSGRALSLHIFDLSMNIPGGDPNAAASALTLLVLLLGINSIVIWIGENWLHKQISL